MTAPAPAPLSGRVTVPDGTSGVTPRAYAVALFTYMTTRPDWHGFGYLGGRETALHADADARPVLPVGDVDERVLREAAARGWTFEQLFAWANSRPGRHFADAAFGSGDLDLAIGRWNLLSLDGLDV